MREQLAQYVNLLFAGSPGNEDMLQEILQNTLDRYDDLLAQGKTPEAAYRLAISGIGDVNEIISTVSPTPSPVQSQPAPAPVENPHKTIMHAVAIGLYICCVIPVVALSAVGDGVIGVCVMFIMIAAATVLLILSSDEKEEKKAESAQRFTPSQELRKAVKKAMSAVALLVFLAVSFSTNAWHVTWLIFPIMAALRGIIFACMDLKEAKEDEA